MDKVCDFSSGANPSTIMRHNITISNPGRGVTFYLYWDEGGTKANMIFDKEEGNFEIYGINLWYKVGPNELMSEKVYNITMAVFDAQDYEFNTTFIATTESTKKLRYYQISYISAFIGGCAVFIVLMTLLICIKWCAGKNEVHDPVNLKSINLSR